MRDRSLDGPVHPPSRYEAWTIFGLGLVAFVLVIIGVMK